METFSLLQYLYVDPVRAIEIGLEPGEWVMAIGTDEEGRHRTLFGRDAHLIEMGREGVPVEGQQAAHWERARDGWPEEWDQLEAERTAVAEDQATWIMKHLEMDDDSDDTDQSMELYRAVIDLWDEFVKVHPTGTPEFFGRVLGLWIDDTVSAHAAYLASTTED